MIEHLLLAVQADLEVLDENDLNVGSGRRCRCAALRLVFPALQLDDPSELLSLPMHLHASVQQVVVADPDVEAAKDVEEDDLLYSKRPGLEDDSAAVS